MFIDFNEQFEIKECSFDIESNGRTDHQVMQAPKMVIIQQFLSLIQQAINTDIPVKITMATMIPVYSDKIAGYRNMKSMLEFKNNACLDKGNMQIVCSDLTNKYICYNAGGGWEPASLNWYQEIGVIQNESYCG